MRQGLVPPPSSCSLLFCTSLGQGKRQCPCPCLAAGIPTAPFLLLPEQKRDVYDRYGKDGLMGAGEWVSRATGVSGALDTALSEDPVWVCAPPQASLPLWGCLPRALLN